MLDLTLELRQVQVFKLVKILIDGSSPFVFKFDKKHEKSNWQCQNDNLHELVLPTYIHKIVRNMSNGQSNL